MFTILIDYLGSRSARRQALTLGALLSLASLLAQAQAPKAPGGKWDKTGPPTPAAAIARLIDDSNLTVLVLEESIELHTRHGKLSIPLSEVAMIEFRLRLPEEIQKQVAVAIANLGHADFQRREAGSSALLALREKAYPALVQAAKSMDLEVARRTEQILEKLAELIPEQALKSPATDIVHTGDSRIEGDIKSTSFRVRTVPFGDQSLKLADIRTLTSRDRASDDALRTPDVIPDPGTLAGIQARIGQSLAFRVTAQPIGLGGGGVYGTIVYTMDSSLANAAVHAGALRPGQTAIVRVTILGPQAGFQGTTQNGLTSQPYGPWNGFRIEVPKAAAQ